MRTKSRIIKLFNQCLYILSAAILIAGTFLTTTTIPVQAEVKIDICHADGNSGKYSKVNVSANSSISQDNGQCIFVINGHAGHDKDIIPPFTDTTGCVFAGQGDQAILANNCVVPVYGCMDTHATNYDPSATADNGSCLYNICKVSDYSTHTGVTAGQLGSYSIPPDYYITSSSPACQAPKSGCTNVNATNYDATAVVDDGSCTFNVCEVPGYVSHTGVNSTALATYSIPPSFYITANSPCTPPAGCTDSNATNYDANAVVDDGSCTYNVCEMPGYITHTGINATTLLTYSIPPSYYITDQTPCTQVPGCMDVNATNYNSTANVDNGSCTYDVCEVPGYISHTGITKTALLGFTLPPSFYITDTTPCELAGCMDETATNYNASATVDDGSCLYNVCEVTATTYNTFLNVTETQLSLFTMPPSFLITTETPCVKSGCTDTAATNYDQYATKDDGSCLYDACVIPGYTISSGISLAAFNTLLITNPKSYTTLTPATCVPPTGCTDPTATNYDPAAVVDDGSCTYGPPPPAVKGLILLDPSCNADGTVKWTVENPNSSAVSVLFWNVDGGVKRGGFSAAPGTTAFYTGVQGTHTVKMTYGESQTVSLTSTTTCGTLIPVTGAELPIPATGGGGLVIPVTGADDFGQLGQSMVFSGFGLLGFALMVSALRKKLGLL